MCSGDEHGVNSASSYPSFLFLLYHFSVRFSPSNQWKVVGLASCRVHQLIQADIKCNLSDVDELWGHCWIFDAETRLAPVDRHRLIQQHGFDAPTRGKKCNPQSDGFGDIQQLKNICQNDVEQPRTWKC